MLSSLLLHLDGEERSAAVVRSGVELAQRHQARLRGLSIVDTRSMSQLAECETAAYVALEQARLEQLRSRHQSVRADLSQACLAAEIDFDVRCAQGDPVRLLEREAQFHDLVVTSLAPPPRRRRDRGGFLRTLREVAGFVRQGIQPLLVLRANGFDMKRVLLVCDGTPASGRAIRLSLQQRVWTDAEVRLLAVNTERAVAQRHLREMADYLRTHRCEVEAGCLTGAPERLLAAYAEKWQADLVVVGMTRLNPLAQRLWGDGVVSVLRHTSCGVYVTT